jgi:hypothetical protein
MDVGVASKSRAVTQYKPAHQGATQRLSAESLHLAKEVRSIQRRAAEHTGRIVSIGPLLFFSTDSGDAWLLEPASQLACRLASGGDPLPVYIGETDTTYTITWPGHYRIEGETFVYEDEQSHRLVAIRGYPLKQLLRSIGHADRA